ncbi:glycosyltransferase family 2 protein [Candidatus Gottesmanbacteria bacterium]|nr:glycosyltransferase family 2 protein [Candidatus Gottesmanbacteria bacterium]
MKNLFIIIVSLNGGGELVQLVESLNKEKVSGWEVKILLVNNAVKKLNIISDKLKVNIIENKANLGFARGANIGVTYALRNQADRILLLNPDTAITPGFLNGLTESSDDIVSPVIKFKRNHNWIYDYGGKIDWNIGRTYHLESINKLIDYVSGCCMLVKREVFEKIGFFDENFFLYFEDADFCFRAKKAGFSIAASSKSFIVHQLIEGNERSSLKKYHLIRSNFIFINKYMGIKKIIGYLYLSALAIKMFL